MMHALSTLLLLSAAISPHPNVLVVLTDQQQAAALGAAGNPNLKTPAMDAVARGGVLFTHAFTPTPQCSPARASLMTGRYPHQAGVDTNMDAIGSKGPLADRGDSLARRFRAAGYETAYFGKWHLGPGPDRLGFEIHASGTDTEKADQAVAYLRSAKPPFLCVVSFLNPHDIYQIRRVTGQDRFDLDKIRLPASFADTLVDKPPPQLEFLRRDQGRVVSDFNNADWKRYIAYYNRLVEQVDREVGRVLAALRLAGHERNTVVVFTSDHGDLAGAHGLPFKGPAMYDELIRVPLAIRYPPKIPAAAVRSELVTITDILPTVCSLAGIPVPEGLDGRDLSSLAFGKQVEWRDRVYGQYHSKQQWANPIRMVRTRRWKYCLYRAGYKELYDLANDPAEMNNLAGEPEHRAIQQSLHADLIRWIRRSDDRFFEMQPTDRQGRPIAIRPMIDE